MEFKELQRILSSLMTSLHSVILKLFLLIMVRDFQTSLKYNNRN